MRIDRLPESTRGTIRKPIMFTRFQTLSAVHIFDAPLIEIPPNTPGAMFLGTIGGAYEFDDEHLCSRLLQFGTDLEVAIQQPDLIRRRGVPEFLVTLRSVIEFLHSANENSVHLYSYERVPPIEDLLDAFDKGGAGNDWALKELRRKGEKGWKALLSILTRTMREVEALRRFRC